MEEKKTPAIIKKISDFLYEEEANISRKKIISVGTLIVLATILLSEDIFAKHYSHSSHSSHSSHVSSSHGSSHSNHYSHQSHQSHSSHVSSGGHSSHSSSVGHTNHSSSVGHNSHSSTVTHSAHASHSSSATIHASHSSSVSVPDMPTHLNSGIAIDESAAAAVERSIPDFNNEGIVNDNFIDIRTPLIPPDSPHMSDGGN